MFPEISDWTKPSLYHVRGKSIKELTQKEWFFLHPICFNIINLSVSAVSFITFSIGSILILYYWHKTIIASILALFALIQFLGLIKKLHALPITKNMSFYDLWMKESEYDMSEKK